MRIMRKGIDKNHFMVNILFEDRLNVAKCVENKYDKKVKSRLVS